MEQCTTHNTIFTDCPVIILLPNVFDAYNMIHTSIRIDSRLLSSREVLLYQNIAQILYARWDRSEELYLNVYFLCHRQISLPIVQLQLRVDEGPLWGREGGGGGGESHSPH